MSKPKRITLNIKPTDIQTGTTMDLDGAPPYFIDPILAEELEKYLKVEKLREIISWLLSWWVSFCVAFSIYLIVFSLVNEVLGR